MLCYFNFCSKGFRDSPDKIAFWVQKAMLADIPVNLNSVISALEIINKKVEVQTMKKHITNEKTGISYTLHGDYYLSNFIIPPEKEQEIGV